METTQENKKFFGELLLESHRTGRGIQGLYNEGWVTLTEVTFSEEQTTYRLEPENGLMKVSDLPPVCFIKRQNSPAHSEIITARNDVRVYSFSNAGSTIKELHDQGYLWSLDMVKWTDLTGTQWANK